MVWLIDCCHPNSHYVFLMLLSPFYLMPFPNLDCSIPVQYRYRLPRMPREWQQVWKMPNLERSAYVNVTLVITEKPAQEQAWKCPNLWCLAHMEDSGDLGRDKISTGKLQDSSEIERWKPKHLEYTPYFIGYLSLEDHFWTLSTFIDVR
jgi:hypothetical protein